MNYKEDRINWRSTWLDSINELTTLELQQKTWTRKIIITESPHWSYDEFICCYFDDLLYYDYSHFLKIEWISQQEYEIIKDWHMELIKYNAPKKIDYYHRVILEDKKWLNILKKGEKVKANLIEILADSEKKYLLGIKSYPNFRKVSLLEQITHRIKMKLGK